MIPWTKCLLRDRIPRTLELRSPGGGIDHSNPGDSEGGFTTPTPSRDLDLRVPDQVEESTTPTLVSKREHVVFVDQTLLVDPNFWRKSTRNRRPSSVVRAPLGGG